MNRKFNFISKNFVENLYQVNFDKIQSTLKDGQKKNFDFLYEYFCPKKEKTGRTYLTATVFIKLVIDYPNEFIEINDHLQKKDLIKQINEILKNDDFLKSNIKILFDRVIILDLEGNAEQKAIEQGFNSGYLYEYTGYTGYTGCTGTARVGINTGP